MAPIVLGNAPKPEEALNHEKIAFMGQVPVRVVGKVTMGDYILPSGNNDGYAIAVHPNDMLPGDYRRVVGVAWEAGDLPVNFINVAVGINANDLSGKVEELNRKVDIITAYLDGKLDTNGSPLNEESLQQLLSQNKQVTQYQKLITDEQFDAYLDANASTFDYFFAQAKLEFEASGYEVKNKALVEEIFNDPVKHLKRLRRDPGYLSMWPEFDQKILDNQRKD
jgi:hypothetical protein